MSKSGQAPERSLLGPMTDQSSQRWKDDGDNNLGEARFPKLSVTVEKATRWTCNSCGVSAGQLDGRPTELPEGWTSSEGELCLICRRERAADEVLALAPEVHNLAARVRLRKAALLDFEVSRVPDRPNGKIAVSCHTSVRAVAESRQRLQAASDAGPAE
jgi:hypothetical protein